MNRKTKKQMKIVVIVLFFLITGAVYFAWNYLGMVKKNSTELTGVSELPLKEAPTELPEKQEDSGKTVQEQKELVVYVCGSVKEPGIYKLTPGSRLYEAVALAGGLSAEADASYHNLARSISDGERIYILSFEETKALSVQQQITGEAGKESGLSKNGLTNLNTATVEQLMELPGIGEAKAKDILEYRTGIGQFTAPEEIMNVSGIGEAMYEKIKDKITVK